MSELLEKLAKTKDKKEQRKIKNMLNKLGMDDWTIEILLPEIKKELKNI